MPRFASEAERLRHHRQCFTLALELGCTPREAEATLRKREALARIEDGKRRLAAMTAAPMPAQFGPLRDEPWMMRDLDK